MLRAGALRRLSLSLLLAVTAAVGTAGCILAPVPAPVAVGPPAVVVPGVIVGPRPYYRGPYYRGHGFYRGGYHRGYGHWH
jgi:hypothetical protein